MADSEAEIILYTSNFCAHSWTVERFMEKNNIPVTLINIDNNREAREKVIAINNGYASVPTLVFADGSHLTEPSFRALRARLGIKHPTLSDRIRSLLGLT